MKNMSLFTDGFEPSQIEHRDKQINELFEFFETFKTSGFAPNIYLSGRTGTGKTVCMKHVMKNYEGYCIYVSAISNNTPLKVIRAMSDKTFATVEKCVSSFCESLKKEPKILIIDEVNKIKDLRNFFNLLNLIFRETSVPIAVISNKPRLLDCMETDAKQTLFLERIDFQKYTSEELYDIIKKRIELLNNGIDASIPEETLRRICKIAYNEGSARDALSLTFRCILKQDFSEEFITQLQKSREQEEWEEFINSLKPSERKFLKVVLDLFASRTPINNCELQRKLELSPARISQLITSFIDYGIFDYKYQWGYGKNRRGRYRQLHMPQEIFNKLDGLIE